jgi:maleate isomerase
LCTNFRGAEVVDSLEEEIGIPIYDSVNITLWKCLKMCNIKTEVIKGWGRLFKQ